MEGERKVLQKGDYCLMGRDLRLREGGFLEEEDFRSLSWGQGKKAERAGER